MQVKMRVFRNVNDVWKTLIHRITLRFGFHRIPVKRGYLRKGVPLGLHMKFPAEVLSQIVAGKHQRPAGVLLITKPEKVRRNADLGFNLLLAIPEIIIGDDRDDDAILTATRQFESLAVVVKL